MTEITIKPVVLTLSPTVPRIWPVFMNYCSQFTEGACNGQQMAARYHELSRLSGADLATRGLTRQTLGRAVLTGH